MLEILNNERWFEFRVRLILGILGTIKQHIRTETPFYKGKRYHILDTFINAPTIIF